MQYEMPQKVKQFAGFSGSDVWLYLDSNGYFVRKINNTKRNNEKLCQLHLNGYLVPKVIRSEGDILDIEYIDGIDMETYINAYGISRLIEFMEALFNQFKSTSYFKDYSNIYIEQLAWTTNIALPFSAKQLHDKLPKVLPTSLCHGDFTLENLIFKDNKFYMIDASTGPYDSYIFDLAKLRQDIDGKWFLRHSANNKIFDNELSVLRNKLFELFPEAFDDMLYILMLLRVLKYTIPNSKEQILLTQEIYKLWKY